MKTGFLRGEGLNPNIEWILCERCEIPITHAQDEDSKDNENYMVCAMCEKWERP